MADRYDVIHFRRSVSRRQLATRAVLACLGTLALLGGVVPTADGAAATSSAADRKDSPKAQYWGAFSDVTGHVGEERTPFTIRLPGRVAQVGSSNSTVYALLTDGRLYAWGVGGAGQLGNGTRTDSLRTPVRVRFPPGVKIASIPADVMPYDEGLAVDTTRHVWGWGTNPFGDALCLGTRRAQLLPVRLSFSNVTLVAGAFGHALYTSHGRVYACGSNLFGELGDGTRRPASTPVRVRLPAHARVTKVVAAWANSGALLADGRYYNWGYNLRGQLGQGTVGGFAALPQRVHLPRRVVEVAQGGSLPINGQSLALLANGDLYAWGDGRQFQLGTGNRRSQPLPVRIRQPGHGFRDIATGGATSYGITADGDVYAWGYNGRGSVGDGTSTDAPYPVRVAGRAAAISATQWVVVISGGKRGHWHH